MAYKDKSDAIKYNNAYNSKTYDRINLTMPKGKKDAVHDHATKHGQSVNAFINAAIDEKMERDQASSE